MHGRTGDRKINLASSGRSVFADFIYAQGTLGATDEGITTFVKPEKSMGRPRDSNADGPIDGSHGTFGDAKPEWPRSAEIESVVAAFNLQGGRQPSGTSRQVQ